MLVDGYMEPLFAVPTVNHKTCMKPEIEICHKRKLDKQTTIYATKAQGG